MSSSTPVNSIPNPLIMMEDTTLNISTENVATKQTTLSEKGVKVSVGGCGYLGRIGRRISGIWTQQTQL